MSRPVFSFIPSSLIGWGSLVEVCSPSPQLARDVAYQAAHLEATRGPVLWLAVGSAAAAAAAGGAGGGLEQVPNLTVQHWPITSDANSREALQQLLRVVRSQQYSLVVLDDVVGLAPPLVRPPPPQLPQAPAAAAAAGQGVGARLEHSERQPGQGLELGLGTSGGSLAGAREPPGAVGASIAPPPLPPAEKEAPMPPGSAPRGAVSPSGSEVLARATRGRLAAAAAALRGGAHPVEQEGVRAAPGGQLGRPGGTAAAAAVGQQRGDSAMAACGHPRLNLKFLNNLLPALLDATLSQLAASCGPGFGVTTLLLNSYSRPRDKAWGAVSLTPAPNFNGANAVGTDTSTGGSVRAPRSRPGRRSVVRNVTATLHLLQHQPNGGRAAAGFGARGAVQPPSDGFGNGSGGGEGGAWGGGAGLHAEVTTGVVSTGEDSLPLFVGSILQPVRHPGPRPEGHSPTERQ